MIAVLMWIALSLTSAQIIAGVSIMFNGITEFNDQKFNKLPDAVSNEGSRYSYMHSTVAQVQEKMLKFSNRAKRGGILSLLSPFAIVLIPLAGLVFAGIGTKKAVAKIAPALTYTPKDDDQ